MTDCQAALDVITKGAGERRVLAQSCNQYLHALRSHVQDDLVWVPSHGKLSAVFCGTPGYSEAQLRAFNHEADAEAGAYWLRLARASPLARWTGERECAHDWETIPLRTLVAASGEYQAFAASL